MLKDTYRHASSHTPLEKLFGVGLNTFTELASQMDFFENKIMNLSSLDIEFGKVNYTNVKGENNNKMYMMRFEFMEMMVRIAGYAFMQADKKFKTWHEACEFFFANYCEPYFQKFDEMHVWRKQIAWKEENDYIMKTHMQIFENV